MKNIKHLSDLTELSGEELNKAYKKYEPSINALRITGLNFWIGASILGVIGFLYFTDNPLGEYQTGFLTLLIISTYYLGERLGYKKGFIEGYEAGWSDGIKKAIKFERNITDEDFLVMEDMDNSAKYGI